jgi:TonB-linked SusC/RagA family outer membrane protein
MKMKKHFLFNFTKGILFTLMWMISLCMFAQNITVKGTVRDSKGEPLIGATVRVSGTTTGTVTDIDGNFTLINVPTDATLEITYVGMKTQVISVNGRTTINVVMEEDAVALEEVVAIGYGYMKKESLTGAITSVRSDDIEKVSASTVSSTLAGKLAGVSFRQAEGRPGAGANISIRNMGSPLYIIDGIQKDEGQFNNLSPTDIESITVLKDASAAIYGVRAANGVVVVTTKSGRRNTKPSIKVNARFGFQNWTRFPETCNAYEWMLGKADAEMNRVNPHTDITPEELEKWREGKEYGYQSFDWYDFIIKPNAPMNQINISSSGGSDRINYYLSYTHLYESSVLGREFIFKRDNVQANVDGQITDNLRVGMKMNGRIETRDNPGVPGGDDYWAPRFALFRNRPTERPYANDNPKYINDIGHNDTNWALLTKDLSGYWTETWRVLQTNFDAEYALPIEGLKIKGNYSYYIADRLMDGHEYTYKAYKYFPETDEYKVTFTMDNPWRERGTHKVLEDVFQVQINYNKVFGNHTVDALLLNERIHRRDLDTWVHAVPNTNVLPLIYFADMDTYNDSDVEQARIGYIGKFNYNYSNKYYIELAGRYDGSWKFIKDKRWGFFPSVSGGWRITEEEFAKNLLGDFDLDLKLRASYGELGDDAVGIGDFDYLRGYNYNSSTVIMDGKMIIGARDRGEPITNISWYTSKITDIGADFSLLDTKLSGSIDYFYRKREGLRGRKYDVLVPSELGYALPDENVNSDAVTGGELLLSYNGKANDFIYSVGGNISYARQKFLESYKPRWGNSWDHYRNSRENRWDGTFWGYEVIGQFQSYEQINNYPVNIDGQGNKTLLPGDLIYKDVNQDGAINGYDVRPIGYPAGRNPILNYGINASAQYKDFDISMDFSGGSMYSYNQNWEMRWPYQNTGNLLRQFYDDRWHRVDPFDVNSEWIPGKYPPLRFNEGGHSNYNKNSTFWLTNVRYLRLKTIELGYTLPKELSSRIGIQTARFYINGFNLFSFDNVRKLGIEPEIMDENGLQYPQHKRMNIGVNVSF